MLTESVQTKVTVALVNRRSRKSQSPRHVHRAGNGRRIRRPTPTRLGSLNPSAMPTSSLLSRLESGPKLPPAVLLKSDSMGLCSQRVRGSPRGIPRPARRRNCMHGSVRSLVPSQRPMRKSLSPSTNIYVIYLLHYLSTSE